MGFFGSCRKKIKGLGNGRHSSTETLSGSLSKRHHAFREDRPSVLLEKRQKPAERVRGDDFAQARLYEAQLRDKDLKLKSTGAEIEHTKQQYIGTLTPIPLVPRKAVAPLQDKGQFVKGVAAVTEDRNTSHPARFVSQAEWSNVGVKLAQMTGDRDYYLTKLVELQNQEQNKLNTRNAEIFERDQRIQGLEAEALEKESIWRQLKGRLEAVATDSDQRIEQLEAKIKGLGAEVVEKDRTCRERGDQLKAVTNTRDSLQLQLRTSGAKSIQERKELDKRLVQLLEDLRARSKIHTTEIKERDQRIASLEAGLLETGTRSREIAEKLGAAAKERDSFQMELRTIEAKLAQASSVSDCDRRQYHTKLAEYQREERERSAVQISKNTEREWELNQLGQQITNLQMEVADKKCSLKRSKSKLKAAVKVIDLSHLILQELSMTNEEKDFELKELWRKHEHDKRKWNDCMRHITMKVDAEQRAAGEMLDRDKRHRTQLRDLKIQLEHQLVMEQNSAQEIARVEERRRTLQERLEATEALLSQRSNRATELEHQLEENTEMIADTRLILNRSRNEAAMEKRKAQHAAQEVADKNRKMEFMTQECARIAAG